jgi:hypothetical protein
VLSSRAVLFGLGELQRFLEAVDAALTLSAELTVIGGGAIALGYGVDVGTRDIDTYNSTGAAVDEAVTSACHTTGLHIPLGQAGVADLPYDYADRLHRIMPHLLRLLVWVPEKHDLALSKVIRGNEHDMQQILALHAVDRLDREVLIERFVGEMSQVVGSPRMIALSFLDCLDRLFGDDGGGAERRLRGAGRY